MSSFVAVSFAHCYNEVMMKLDVEKVLDDMVTSVEVHSMESLLLSMEEQLKLSQSLHEELKIESESLLAERNWNAAEFERIRSEAISVRDILIHDVTDILVKNTQAEKYLKRIRELEEKDSQSPRVVRHGSSDVTNPAVSHLNYDETPLQDIYVEPPLASLYEFADSCNGGVTKYTDLDPHSSNTLSSRKCPQLIKDLEDKLLLLYVSFLDVSDVLIVSQLNRLLFARLDQLFQNGSPIPKASWLINASRSNPKSVVNDSSHAGTLASNEVIDVNRVETIESIPSSDEKNTASPTGNGVKRSVPGKSSTGEGRYFGKFSMLLAAADNLLPNALTNGVMSAVGVNRVLPSSPVGSSTSASNGKIIPSHKNGIEKSVTFQTGFSSSTSASSSSSSATGGLTREIAESLSKKLSATEMKAIIGMDDLLKKNTSRLEISIAENEDLSSKLQGILTLKDFLISKLKGAEEALKNSMVECTSLKKLSKADDEIITYLDLRSQEFEAKNVELTLKTEQLQAAYNLQCGSYSHRENQLFSELSEFKLKYDELESNYKSHKRLLVAEVKSLRFQLTSSVVEKNKCIAQLMTVKNVLNLDSNGIA